MTLDEQPWFRSGGRPSRPLAAALLAGALCACAGQPPPAAVATSPAVGRSPPETRTAPEPSGTVTSGSAATTTPTQRSITLIAGGDVLLHEPTWAQADADAGVVGDGALDFTATLAGIEPVVSAADLALCHLEAPLAPEGGPYAGYPAFAMPPQIVGALRATGFDACSVASNHTLDHGADGVHRTVSQLRAGGVQPYGAADGTHPANPSFVMVGEVKVGLLSYTYGSNSSVQPGGILELLDATDITADARAARASGAQIVVASVHWGTEYDHLPNAQQLTVAAELATSPDIDLVIGHHAHVVQPIAQVGGTWVAYGLGNLLAAQATPVPANREGVLARFELTEGDDGWDVTDAGYLPTFVERVPTLRVLALGGPAVATPRQTDALVRTRKAVHSGSSSAGLVEILPPL